MITTPTFAATFVQAAHLLATHLTEHGLPQPASLEVISTAHRSRLTAQVHFLTVPTIAAELLTWADTDHGHHSGNAAALRAPGAPVDHQCSERTGRYRGADHLRRRRSRPCAGRRPDSRWAPEGYPRRAAHLGRRHLTPSYRWPGVTR
ncbi:MAG: hypothetical protein ACRDR6_13070 [Pseudonocardiaceae bacterium]